jgi:hypothetical protein
MVEVGPNEPLAARPTGPQPAPPPYVPRQAAPWGGPQYGPPPISAPPASYQTTGYGQPTGRGGNLGGRIGRPSTQLLLGVLIAVEVIQALLLLLILIR